MALTAQQVREIVANDRDHYERILDNLQRGDSEYAIILAKECALNDVLNVIDSMQKNQDACEGEIMSIHKDWFNHCKKSWYKEGYIDGKHGRPNHAEEDDTDWGKEPTSFDYMQAMIDAIPQKRLSPIEDLGLTNKEFDEVINKCLFGEDVPDNTGLDDKKAHKDAASKEWSDGFECGKSEMYNDMMEDAIDAEVSHDKSLVIPSLNWLIDNTELNVGDKVKLVVIKEEYNNDTTTNAKK